MSYLTAARPTVAFQPLRTPLDSVQAARVEKRKKHRSSKNTMDMRRAVLVRNAMNAAWQKKREQRKRKAAANAVKAATPCIPTAETSYLPIDPALLDTPTVSSPNISTTPPAASSTQSSSDAKIFATCPSSPSNTPQVAFGMSDMNLQLKHDQGDVIEKASENGVIVHACNCLGAWGSGIALQLKKHFPAAFKVYNQHCKDSRPAELFGSCLLIPPQPDDYSATKTRSNRTKKPVWIACLFTSVGWGKGNKRTGNPGVASKDDILKATSTSLMGLLLEWQDARVEEQGKDGKMPGDIFCPRFNAGSFGVPWEGTEELILQKWNSVEVEWTVVSN